MARVAVVATGVLCILIADGSAWGCPECRGAVKAEVYKPGFAANLLMLWAPVGVMVAIGLGVLLADSIKATFRGRTAGRKGRESCGEAP